MNEKKMLDVCEKYANILEIPYFTMIENIYELYKNEQMTRYNNYLLQEIYTHGVFDLKYRNAFREIYDVDRERIENWVVPILESSYIDFLKMQSDSGKRKEKFDCMDIYNKSFKITEDTPGFYLKIYDVNSTQMYIISQKNNDNGLIKYFGHKVTMKQDHIFGKDIVRMNDLWLTVGINTIQKVNTVFANDYILSFINNTTIPNTKFNIGEEFFVSRLIDDFNKIINNDMLDVESLEVDELMKLLQSNISR